MAARASGLSLNGTAIFCLPSLALASLGGLLSNLGLIPVAAPSTNTAGLPGSYAVSKHALVGGQHERP